MITKIQKQPSEALLNIINEILDSAKIEAGMMEIVPVDYEISSLLNDLYNIMQIKAKEKGLTLVFDIDPTIPKMYYGDDKVVDVNIRRLRMKIEENPSEPRYISTIRGFGYKWCVDELVASGELKTARE